MKRILFSTLLAIIATISVQAQQIKLEYESKVTSLPELMQQYFQMQNVQHSSLTMKGAFNGKRAKIKKVVCDKGTFTERDLLQEYVHFIFTDSVETIDFMAVPYGKDSLRISCFYPTNFNQVIFNDTVRLDNMKILLETFTPGDGPDIPIMAYSTGIPFEGGTWFCGLRDSGVEPRKWFEKYGIDGYVFYTIRLEEDTSNDNMPIYVKIAKQDSHAIHQQ